MNSVRMFLDSFNGAVGKSTFGRIFRLQGCGHDREIKNTKFTTEIRAGLTTFFTMAYIIAVNASVLSATGGNCVCKATATDALCDKDNDYADCVADLNRSLITATAALSGFSSFLFGFVTNMPVCLGPGMGLNAYFAYQIVGYHGSGLISYNLALTAVFVEGFIFIFLSLIGMRQWLVKAIPVSLKIASACGIGLFLSEIGLSYSAGIGAITGAKNTPLEVGGCPSQYLDDSGSCQTHRMTSPTMWIGIFCGGIFTAYLMTYKVKSAMIAGIALVSILSWPRDTPFTYFPHNPQGDERFNFFKKVINFHPIGTLNVLDWNVSKDPTRFVLTLFTFLYVDIIDCTATLYSMARFSGVVDAETGDFPRSTLAYCTDALCISIGALLGCSPVTAFIESGAGIAEGGKTGLTAMTCGICFLISMFFAPIFASIPPWATGCTLILVGCLMMRQIVSVNWRYIGDAVPAFVTVMFIPFGYSAAYGLIAGLMTYAALNGLIYLTKVISRGYVVPDDEDHREYWTIKPHGKLPWFITASQLLAGRIGHHNGQQKDTTSIKSGESQVEIRGDSKNLDQELDAVVVIPKDPRDEVLRKTQSQDWC
ncbi:hypothetical protein K504DRAFT_69750 [Pleomassaria siparia CBS 279.74]|uniref:Purine transporter n=1 Tax=Pleomassaria siparia CBS 279.74 TaxID=1314801 RepID=A0A6G1K259_9PLEO|nr:hypothetical protein K504DRAFT_69750 [Pleomassaria siparia CBS 279.74]